MRTFNHEANSLSTAVGIPNIVARVDKNIGRLNTAVAEGRDAISLFLDEQDEDEQILNAFAIFCGCKTLRRCIRKSEDIEYILKLLTIGKEAVLDIIEVEYSPEN